MYTIKSAVEKKWPKSKEVKVGKKANFSFVSLT